MSLSLPKVPRDGEPETLTFHNSGWSGRGDDEDLSEDDPKALLITKDTETKEPPLDGYDNPLSSVSPNVPMPFMHDGQRDEAAYYDDYSPLA